MVYKFDILIKKNLNSGGQKVVTYGTLLENPEVFGRGESLANAEGQLSLVLEGPEEGYSINTLYRKYGAQLVGYRNSEILGKYFPLRFVFAKPDDPYSIKMELRNEDGNTCAIDTDFFVLLVSKDSDCSIICGDTITRLQQGQAAFCTSAAEQLTIVPDEAHTIIVK